MGLLTMMSGATAGVGLQVYSNTVRRLPMMRHPWEHVAFAIGGAWAASSLVAWEGEQKEELRKTLTRQGRPTTAYSRDQ